MRQPSRPAATILCFSSRHASASPAHRASLRRSRAGPRGCCRVRPPPSHPKSGCNIFLCGSLLGLPQPFGVFPPAMRPRPQPQGLACGGAALAPGAVAASAPHPATLKADVKFLYAAAFSACRRQRGFVLPPCWRHLQITFRCCYHFLHHRRRCGWLAATRSPSATLPLALLGHPGMLHIRFVLFRLCLNSKVWVI